MEFVAQFIEIICMIALLGGIGLGFLYLLRHRTRFNRWIDNFGSPDNAADKEHRIRGLRLRIDDAEAQISELESEARKE